jgi:DNA-binding IclR family transcriptional regulator
MHPPHPYARILGMVGQADTEAAGEPGDGMAVVERGGNAQGGRTVQSLERAFAILEAIAGSDQALSLAELSRTTGLHTSTAFHLIKTLILLGYVRQEDTKRYRIGPRLFMQAAGASNEIGLVNFATPHLKQLADETGETAHLAVRADTGIAVVAKVEARSTVRTSERLGIVRPAYCTAIGKMLLADLPADALEAYLRTETLEAFTPKTITAPAQLRDEIKRVAGSGIAYDDAEFSHELRCIAAPVRNYTRQTVAALGISGPVWRVTLQEMRRLGVQVAAVAAELSRDLGFKAQTQPRQLVRARRKPNG